MKEDLIFLRGYFLGCLQVFILVKNLTFPSPFESSYSRSARRRRTAGWKWLHFYKIIEISFLSQIFYSISCCDSSYALFRPFLADFVDPQGPTWATAHLWAVSDSTESLFGVKGEEWHPLPVSRNKDKLEFSWRKPRLPLRINSKFTNQICHIFQTHMPLDREELCIFRCALLLKHCYYKYR